MSQPNKLSSIGIQIDSARQRHDLTLYRVAKNAVMDYAQLYRTMRQSNPTRETLTRICNAIDCTSDERKEIFHAAGYLSPDEIEEEERAA